MKGPLINVNINQSVVEKPKEVDYTDLNKGEVFMNDSHNEEIIKNYIMIIEKQIEVQFAINNMMETDLKDTSIVSPEKLDKLIFILTPSFENFRYMDRYEGKLFHYDELNRFLFKIAKAMILIYTSLYITLNEYSITSISLLIKIHFNKLMNYISGCLFNVFFIFCKGEMKQHIKNYTKEDFDIKFHELYFNLNVEST